ncbi:hypothetical protein JL193_14815 [Polaribacter batillariae]|uniref:PKD domain-containing protein n=1 Tax=Polaribacter batillariae TaxID=2808900 RepID=A0ABX7SVK2_9FLAO|nr:LamG-like jellyroll fold domain-containing protein [Polaribacter batillariae]QTD37353.1 hypothetical protein JL193_14815 [Polaribacter batillariae]
MKFFKTYYIIAVFSSIIALNLSSCTKLNNEFALDKNMNTNGLPDAEFTASTTSIFQFETISFAPNSVNEGDLYSWSFPGGSPSESSTANVDVKYTVKGIYLVSLKVRNKNGAVETVKEDFITVEGEPLDPAVRLRFNFEQNILEEYSGNTASYGGAASYVEDAPVNDFAFKFDGKNSITTPEYKGINGNNPRTVAAWIKSAATKNSCVVHWGASALLSRATFRMTPASIRMEWAGGGISGATKINDDKWHHVAYTFDGSTVTLYVDGKVDGVNSNASKINTGVAGKTAVEVGSQLGANFYSGLMDDVRIYNKALTIDEIKDLAAK